MDPQQQQAQTQALHLVMAIMPIILLFGIAMAAFFIFLYWRILSKAGLTGPLALLALIPGISRSGATIVGGLLRGVNHEGSAHFSFLIATRSRISSSVT